MGVATSEIHPFGIKTTYLIDLILTMSEKFTQNIFGQVRGIRNMLKSPEELYILAYPMIASYTLAKSIEYLSQRFLENRVEDVALIRKLLIAKIREKANINASVLINEYAEKSETNEYMKEMYIGDKICKTIGGTFSNRDLISEISLMYSEFFDKIFVPAMSKVWLMSGLN